LKKLETLFIAFLMFIFVTCIFAGDPNSKCADALRRADAVALRDGTDTDLAAAAAAIDKACIKSTGDIRQLKAGLSMELRAVASLQASRTPAVVRKAISQLETASQLFATCADAEDAEVSASCTFLKVVVEKTAEGLAETPEPAQQA
jgi:hypothetical protein